MTRRSLVTALAAGGAALMAMPASAQDTYKIGISAGLSGYAATVDRAWRDGVEIAAAALNASGGIMGRKLQVIAEDNKSEPQEAVTVYRKMMSSDKVDIFISGCVSAGNFAAAPAVARAEIPMVLCSILPPAPAQKWAYSTLPPAGFEVEKRLEYLRDNTQIRKVGVLHDPTPYAMLQKGVAEQIAQSKFGIALAGVETYKQDDADLSAQLSKMQAGGAGAVLKIGLGGTTLTAAKNLKQLGSNMLMLTSVEDLAVFRPVGEVMGDKFFFVASPSQVVGALPASAMKTEIERFLVPWRAKHGDRDPNWAARGWDAVMITKAAIEKARSFAGPAVRDAIETITGFQGTTGTYDFSPTVHQGITKNPFLLATIAGGQVKIAK